MTRTVADAIDEVKACARTRFVGQDQPDDELLVAEIDRLRAALSLAYAAIREAPDHRVSTGWRMRWAGVLEGAIATEKGGDA